MKKSCFQICFTLVLLACCALFQGCVSTLPEFKERIADYYEGGDYEREVASALEQAKKFLPKPGGYNAVGSAVVFDVDDTALNTYEYQKGMGFGHYGPAWHQWIDMRRATAIKPVLAFYNIAKARGVAVFFVTGRREKFREATEENLRAVGFDGWKGLFMKPTDFKDKSVVNLKTSHRIAIEKMGYKIILNIGDQKSDLEGGHAAHTVLLPNRIYGVR